jgi:hypothetical protein
MEKWLQYKDGQFSGSGSQSFGSLLSLLQMNLWVLELLLHDPNPLYSYFITGNGYVHFKTGVHDIVFYSISLEKRNCGRIIVTWH